MVLFRSGIEIETGRPAPISEGDRGVTLLSPVSRSRDLVNTKSFFIVFTGYLLIVELSISGTNLWLPIIIERRGFQFRQFLIHNLFRYNWYKYTKLFCYIFKI